MPKLKNPNSKRSLEETDESLGQYFERCLKRDKENEAKRRNCLYWSQLPPDLIHSVLKRLSIPDLRRAKSVCSSWHSASRKCFPKSQIPWLIIFPQDDDLNRCKLFNPEEKDKIYTSRDLGVVGFAEDVCVTTYGSWLLMRNPLFNLYILNVLTGQRISLPPVESQLGEIKLKRLVGNTFYLITPDNIGYSKGFKINSPQLWVDEEARDYLVIFSLKIDDAWVSSLQYAIICKKGDQFWRQLPDSSDYHNMVNKDHKLYVLGNSKINVLDLSGELPLKAPKTDDVYVASFSVNPTYLRSVVKKTKLVVTVSGDVLMATMSVMKRCKTCSFNIYKMSSKKNKWERLFALADEAIIWDLGVTVNAKDVEGIRANSIYFSGLVCDANDIFIFDLKTENIERPDQSVCSSLQYSRVRWFFPCFSLKGRS